ncbi:TonB-dependent receptor domain-containing protein [Sphingobacterium sp. E70]|uniref:TonB-dependent receptor domain-containing protein n=1 Tax=Sphingobacterium sp. E70 TaxID=2853439 RepID=UPI00359C207A
MAKLANPAITWEVSKKLDVGLNAQFLKNFTIEAIYFQQKRSDILTERNASIPATSGIVNPYKENSSKPLVPSENIGKVNSEGFEGTLSYQQQGDFSWEYPVILPLPKVKLSSLMRPAVPWIISARHQDRWEPICSITPLD